MNFYPATPLALGRQRSISFLANPCLFAVKVSSCGKVRRAGDYKFFAEFQSHEPEFDYLKSLEIEEKINAIKWCPRVNNALFLLATNGESAVGFTEFELRHSPAKLHFIGSVFASATCREQRSAVKPSK